MKNFEEFTSKFNKKIFCKISDSPKKKSGSVPVYLNVYDLTSMNEYAYWVGLGVYHSGVQVHGIEYAFGAHDFPTTGIFEGEPEQCPGFTFRKSILIGRTDLDCKQVRALMEQLAEKYSGDTYNLITKNCNHFCNDACIKMTSKPIPSWVNRLAKIGLLCICVLPMDIQEAKMRHSRSQERVQETDMKKLRSRSSRFISSSCSSTPCSTSSAKLRDCSSTSSRQRRSPSPALLLSSSPPCNLQI
ncbi:hypothetical protein IFM89_009538 [Coptis chinensis]|uniref:PPPDE domain-containing protein n=1 Tax=Coptis chinensis TaxID=261450 RepID=A0A835I8U7_9MAGN|nr:hypothetical protein IFM89_009538 [Coptis chinensis]